MESATGRREWGDDSGGQHAGRVVVRGSGGGVFCGCGGEWLVGGVSGWWWGVVAAGSVVGDIGGGAVGGAVERAAAVVVGAVAVRDACRGGIAGRERECGGSAGQAGDRGVDAAAARAIQCGRDAGAAAGVVVVALDARRDGDGVWVLYGYGGRVHVAAAGHAVGRQRQRARRDARGSPRGRGERGWRARRCLQGCGGGNAIVYPWPRGRKCISTGLDARTSRVLSQPPLACCPPVGGVVRVRPVRRVRGQSGWLADYLRSPDRVRSRQCRSRRRCGHGVLGGGGHRSPAGGATVSVGVAGGTARGGCGGLAVAVGGAAAVFHELVGGCGGRLGPGAGARLCRLHEPIRPAVGRR
eukprot:ctg_433.g256